MKIILSITIMIVVGVTSTFACTVCKKDQPKILQGIIHGAGPESDWDYLIVAVMVSIVVGTFVLSAKHLINPKESSLNHIKRTILNSEDDE